MGALQMHKYFGANKMWKIKIKYNTATKVFV